MLPLSSSLALCDGQRERERERETRACALSSRLEVLCWVPRAGPADRLQFVNAKNLVSLRFSLLYLYIYIYIFIYIYIYIYIYKHYQTNLLRRVSGINCAITGSPTSTTLLRLPLAWFIVQGGTRERRCRTPGCFRGAVMEFPLKLRLQMRKRVFSSPKYTFSQQTIC